MTSIFHPISYQRIVKLRLHIPSVPSHSIQFRKVARKLTSHGVTAFVPTIVSSNPDTYKIILPKYKRRAGSAKDGATILGQ